MNLMNVCPLEQSGWRKPKVQSFFSRLAATWRKDQGMVGISPDQEDAECLQEDANRQDLKEKVNM